MTSDKPPSLYGQEIIPACRCGEPPFTNGGKCPPCMQLYANEQVAKADAGEISPIEAFMNVLVTSGNFDDAIDDAEITGENHRETCGENSDAV
jgi:hypothetical protein